MRIDLSERSRLALLCANQEAQRFCHEYVSTAHVLLGIRKENSGIAAAVLTDRELELRTIRMHVEKLIPKPQTAPPWGKLPLTPRASKALRIAGEEAQRLANKTVGTEHILLALLCDRHSLASIVLKRLQIEFSETRNEVVRRIGD